MSLADAFDLVRTAFERVGIRYAVGGSWASTAFGEPRFTIRRGSPFNIIHIPTILKFDLFPAGAFPLGAEELERAVPLEDTALSKGPVRFVTPEDILLAKLYWFQLGGEISEMHWRDIQGVVRACGAALDYQYLEQSAAKSGVGELLERAIQQA